MSRSNFLRTTLALKMLCLSIGIACCLASAASQAQEPSAAELERQKQLIRSIVWENGPTKGKVGTLAEIQVPQGYQFTGKEGAAKWMEANQNPADANVLGVLRPTGGFEWFLVFSFNDIGRVPDDEKNSLDANVILKELKAETDLANEERRLRNWQELQIIGWTQPPTYDEQSKHLTWAVQHRTSNGREGVNYNSRILGRNGFMSITLVGDIAKVNAHIPTVKGLLSDFRFTSGNTYAEWRPGEKVAAYGLTGLVAGGLTTAAAKSGWLAKFGKGIAVIIAAAAGFVAWVWKSITGQGKEKTSP